MWIIFNVYVACKDNQMGVEPRDVGFKVYICSILGREIPPLFLLNISAFLQFSPLLLFRSSRILT